jgi:hypothetical protein
MTGERFIYALADCAVEKRAAGWYFSRSRIRHSKDRWQGPYRSEASVAMMIARQLRREITERYQHQDQCVQPDGKQSERAVSVPWNPVDPTLERCASLMY